MARVNLKSFTLIAGLSVASILGGAYRLLMQ